MRHPPLDYLNQRAADRDRFGHSVHVVMACLFLFLLPFGPGIKAVAFAFLVGWACLRLWVTWPSVLRIGDSALTWILLSQAIWWLLSLIWSVDRTQGFDEVGILRLQIPLIFAMWPILDRFSALAKALAVAVCVVSVAQLGQYFGVQWLRDIGFGSAVWDRPPGFLHPSLMGLLALTTGICSCSWLVDRRWKLRLFGALVAGASLQSILLGGSRSIWIATAISWPLALLVVAIRLRVIRSANSSRTKLHSRSVGLGLGLATIGFVLLVGLNFGQIRSRTMEFWSEFNQSIAHPEEHSSIGGRVAQIHVARRLFVEHPWRGVGAGAYFEIAAQTFRSTETDPSDSNGKAETQLQSHPHSALLYTAAVMGLPGVLLYTVFWGVLLLQSLRLARFHVSDPGIGSFNLVLLLPALIVGLGIAFTLDCQNLSYPGMAILHLVCGKVIVGQIMLHDLHTGNEPPVRLEQC